MNEDFLESFLDALRETDNSNRKYRTDDAWPIGVENDRGDPNLISVLPLAEALAIALVKGNLGISPSFRLREIPAEEAEKNTAELWLEKTEDGGETWVRKNRWW